MKTRALRRRRRRPVAQQRDAVGADTERARPAASSPASRSGTRVLAGRRSGCASAMSTSPLGSTLIQRGWSRSVANALTFSPGAAIGVSPLSPSPGRRHLERRKGALRFRLRNSRRIAPGRLLRASCIRRHISAAPPISATIRAKMPEKFIKFPLSIARMLSGVICVGLPVKCPPSGAISMRTAATGSFIEFEFDQDRGELSGGRVDTASDPSASFPTANDSPDWERSPRFEQCTARYGLRRCGPRTTCERLLANWRKFSLEKIQCVLSWF